MIIFTLFTIIQSQIAQLSLNGEGLKEQLLQMIDENQLDCQTIQLLITRGFGQQILDLITTDSIILESHLQCAKQSIQNDLLQLESLKKRFTNHENHVLIKPIILWAQSRANILIKVKFAHRIDAPAYISVKNHQIQYLNQNLQISAESDQNNILTKFYLEIPLLNQVDKTIGWQVESVGTMVLNITKIESKLWLHLSKNKNDKFQIWWDLKEQIGKDMEDFSKMLDNQEDHLKNKKKQQKKSDSSQQSSPIKTNIFVAFFLKFKQWLNKWF
ncbi:unnamed protein product (macronuclear) [Paramecium tetraurelia]|uniref:CS domain-containing protein n=1 Tax=Paramecium tetraurelia TaxID=5888 RepID=A0CCF3_PARTE|nr:uncharacterized protein GSPATT00037255001 [Paramecium tetraurelia]CAK68470.1 unnamed protein product [Paramecium tetraurelia]|eukprot:XP_001435867.1 hypothetical protein (macronuclear) [Paramecium tetraurelia strain d4-2]